MKSEKQVKELIQQFEKTISGMRSIAEAHKGEETYHYVMESTLSRIQEIREKINILYWVLKDDPK